MSSYYSAALRSRIRSAISFFIRCRKGPGCGFEQEPLLYESTVQLRILQIIQLA